MNPPTLDHKTVIIDATHGILGRVASLAAKQSLLGKNVIIVNCNHARVTGKPRSTIAEYLHKRARGGASLKGPFFPKSPERIMKRTVRGMLSYTQGRGLAAFKRVMCYNEVPASYQQTKKVTLHRDTTAKTISLSELSKEI